MIGAVIDESLRTGAVRMDDADARGHERAARLHVRARLRRRPTSCASSSRAIAVIRDLMRLAPRASRRDPATRSASDAAVGRAAGGRLRRRHDRPLRPRHPRPALPPDAQPLGGAEERASARRTHLEGDRRHADALAVRVGRQGASGPLDRDPPGAGTRRFAAPAAAGAAPRPGSGASTSQRLIPRKTATSSRPSVGSASARWRSRGRGTGRC